MPHDWGNPLLSILSDVLWCMRFAILASEYKLFFALCELQRLIPVFLSSWLFPSLRWFPYTHALTNTQQKTQRNPLQISGYLLSYLFLYFPLSFHPSLLRASLFRALASLDSLVYLLNSEKLLNFTCVLLFVLHTRNSLKTVGWNNFRAHLGCFPSPEDHCPVLMSKTIVSHILYNFLIASRGRVNSTPVIPSWPETEVGLVNLLQFIYSAQDPTPRRFSYALPSSPPLQVVYPSLVSL